MKLTRLVLLAVGLVLGTSLGVAVPGQSITTDDVRQCARTACNSMRSCTTAAETTYVKVNNKGGSHTQTAVGDCRSDIMDSFTSCVGGLPMGRVETRSGKTNKASATVAPNANTSSIRNTNSKR